MIPLCCRPSCRQSTPLDASAAKHTLRRLSGGRIPMPEPTFTADELASLFESTPAPAEPDELEALLGREHVHSEPAPPRQAEPDYLLAGLIGDEGRTRQTDDAPSSDGAISSLAVEQTRGAIL